MKKFLTVFSLVASLVAIPLALIYKYPKESKRIYEKAEYEGAKISKKALKKLKKLNKKCKCEFCE